MKKKSIIVATLMILLLTFPNFQHVYAIEKPYLKNNYEDDNQIYPPIICFILNKVRIRISFIINILILLPETPQNLYRFLVDLNTNIRDLSTNLNCPSCVE